MVLKGDQWWRIIFKENACKGKTIKTAYRYSSQSIWLWFKLVGGGWAERVFVYIVEGVRGTKLGNMANSILSCFIYISYKSIL